MQWKSWFLLNDSFNDDAACPQSELHALPQIVASFPNGVL
ncbi:hypothetical protein D805_0530 [Bifidobacterium thermophilum RBL67]|uniref:Uncharacterized protein n=1 Tax=Bifidobacterium thermophilum RBL67 TaxID=1254439 RepID=M4RQJ0_9BIFI|nr:hypothetical protein D805_0530 [Bifidobacterium thermophilum RBL67]